MMKEEVSLKKIEMETKIYEASKNVVYKTFTELSESSIESRGCSAFW